MGFTVEKSGLYQKSKGMTGIYGQKKEKCVNRLPRTRHRRNRLDQLSRVKRAGVDRVLIKLLDGGLRGFMHRHTQAMDDRPYLYVDVNGELKATHKERGGKVRGVVGEWFQAVGGPPPELKVFFIVE